MFSVQCSVFSVECSVCSVRCIGFSVQCSVFSVQYLCFFSSSFLFCFTFVFYVLAEKNESFIAVTVLLDTAQVNAKVCGVNCKV